MSTNQEWNIRARSDACKGCTRAFADLEPIFSRLSFEQGDYVRSDYCDACWKQPQVRDGAPSTWKSVFKLPPPPPPDPLKKETAESLLRELMASNDATRGNAIFILAVMLERRRVLVERDVQVREDGVRVHVYEHRGTGESFTVPDPGLKLTDLEHVQREVLELLGSRPTATPQAAPQAPAADAAPAQG